MRFLRWIGFAVGCVLSAAEAHALALWADGTNAGWPVTANPGSSVTFRIQVEPGQPVRWFHDGVLLPAATEPILTLSDVQSVAAGNYWVEVGASAIMETSNVVTVNVVSPPDTTLDRTFSAGLPVNARVVAVLTGAADESMVVTYDDASGARSIAKLNREGKLDSSFTPPADPGSVLLLLPNGRMLASKYPYLLEANGRPVAGFSLSPNMSASLPLTAAIAYADGRFLAAQGSWVSRWTSDGTLDPTFTYYAPSITGETLYPRLLRLDAHGRVYVDASVTSAFESQYTVAFRLTSSGTYDESFLTQRSDRFSTGFRTETFADGRVFRIDGSGLGYQQETWRLLDDDGAADPAWSESTKVDFLGSSAVDSRNARIFAVLGNQIARWQIGRDSVRRDSDFFSGILVDFHPALSLDGRGDLLVGGSFTEWDGVRAHGLVRLSGSASMAIAPVVTLWASTYSPRKGETVTVAANVERGAGPFSYRWIALDGQPLPPTAGGAELVIPSFQSQHLGRYQALVTGRAGTALSSVLDLRGGQRPTVLANLSARGHTGEGEDTLIAGVIVSQGAYALVRGVGPGLVQFGVSGAIPDPMLRLFSASGMMLNENDNWEAREQRDVIRQVGENVGAFELGPGSHDAAFVASLSAGNYTVHLQPVAGTAHGIGMLELYADMTPQYPGWYPTTQPLRNLSVRAKTGPGDSTAIAGVIIADPADLGRSTRVLLRAIGPTLASQGITHPLADPVLNVFNVKGERIASNDDWSMDNTSGDQTTLAAAMKQVGAFSLATDSKDSALLLDLPPGAYTMHANGGEGVVLLEIYLVP
jgi:hypothetical protein